MEAIGLLGMLIIIGLVAIAIITFPIRLVAAVFGAKNTGTFSCVLALVISGILHSIGLGIPCIGSIAAFVLSSLGFSWIMGTSFWRGIGIQGVSVIFFAIIALILSAIFGVNLVDVVSSYT